MQRDRIHAPYAVEIAKRSGGLRVLGVPTVADRVAQTVVHLYLEPAVEPVFHPDSYGVGFANSVVSDFQGDPVASGISAATFA